MKKVPVITIGREFGSAGREIGKSLAQKLDIPFYDKELISLAAKESGMSREIFETVDEQATNSLLYSMVVGAYALGSRVNTISEMSLNDKLFIIQSNIIKKIAKENPCVIVGRCANYVLKETPHCLHAFIYGDMPEKIARIETLYQVPAKKAEEMISKSDKKRKSYYNYYTGLKWGRTGNYDICLNSSKLGVDTCVDLLFTLAQMK